MSGQRYPNALHAKRFKRKKLHVAMDSQCQVGAHCWHSNKLYVRRREEIRFPPKIFADNDLHCWTRQQIRFSFRSPAKNNWKSWTCKQIGYRFCSTTRFLPLALWSGAGYKMRSKLHSQSTNQITIIFSFTFSDTNFVLEKTVFRCSSVLFDAPANFAWFSNDSVPSHGFRSQVDNLTTDTTYGEHFIYPHI